MCFQYIQNSSICAISFNGSKLNYYFMKYKDIFGGKNKNIDKMPNIKEDLLKSPYGAIIGNTSKRNEKSRTELRSKMHERTTQSYNTAAEHLESAYVL